MGKGKKANMEIRALIKSYGYKYYEMAELLLISESKFFYMLSKELSPERKESLINEINRVHRVLKS